MNAMKTIKITTLLFLVSITLTVKAQTNNIQDCLGAQPICQPVLTVFDMPNGSGDTSEINPAISCLLEEGNSLWYSFTAYQDGNLGFLLIPLNAFDNYNWAVFDITDVGCDEIFSNQDLLISCNAAGGQSCDGLTGPIGLTNYAMQGSGCNNEPPTMDEGFSPFNDFIPVEEGRTYAILISKASGTAEGFTINFTYSDFALYDYVNPEIESTTFPAGCNDTAILLTFSEPINCNTIASINFGLEGPGGPFSLSLSSNSCDTGGVYGQTFELSITPPLFLEGDYTFKVNTNGLDEVLDQCGNAFYSETLPFYYSGTSLPSVDLGTDTTICFETLVLDAENPGASYQWQDGSTESTYLVGETGHYAVTVTNDCGTSISDIWVTAIQEYPEINFPKDTFLCREEMLILNATNDYATYLWSTGDTTSKLIITEPGFYNVTVTTPCGITHGATVIEVYDNIDLTLEPEILACQGDTVWLDVYNEGAKYIWSDGFPGFDRFLTTDQELTVEVTNKCDAKTASTAVRFIDLSSMNLGSDTTLCFGERLMLDAYLPSAVYEWQDGSGLPQFLVEKPGHYWVKATTVCGEETQEIAVNYVEEMKIELGETIPFCGEPFLLEPTKYEQAHYYWQDGSTTDQYLVTGPGTYWLEVESSCQQLVDSLVVEACDQCPVLFPNIFSPNGDGVNDYFFQASACVFQSFQLAIFDRWGNRVFESEDPAVYWDGTYLGKTLQQGVYVWQLTYALMGEAPVDQQVLSGDVTLIR